MSTGLAVLSSQKSAPAIPEYALDLNVAPFGMVPFPSHDAAWLNFSAPVDGVAKYTSHIATTPKIMAPETIKIGTAAGGVGVTAWECNFTLPADPSVYDGNETGVAVQVAVTTGAIAGVAAVADSTNSTHGVRIQVAGINAKSSYLGTFTEAHSLPGGPHVVGVYVRHSDRAIGATLDGVDFGYLLDDNDSSPVIAAPGVMEFVVTYANQSDDDQFNGAGSAGVGVKTKAATMTQPFPTGAKDIFEVLI